MKSYHLPIEIQVLIIDHVDFATLHGLWNTDLRPIAIDSFHKVSTRPDFSTGTMITKATTSDKTAVTLMLEMFKEEFDLLFSLVFRPRKGPLVTVEFSNVWETELLGKWMKKNNLHMDFDMEVGYKTYSFKNFNKYIFESTPIVERYTLRNDEFYREHIICKIVSSPYPLNPNHHELQFVKILKKLRLTHDDLANWDWALTTNRPTRFSLAANFDFKKATVTNEMIYCNILCRMRPFRLVEPIADQWKKLRIDGLDSEVWFDRQGNVVDDTTIYLPFT